jgi:hypothetical protein
MEQPLNEEFSRMQKLAGIDEITVNNPNKSTEENKVPLTPEVKKYINQVIGNTKNDGDFEDLLGNGFFDEELIINIIDDLYPNDDYDGASKEVKDYISQAVKK